MTVFALTTIENISVALGREPDDTTEEDRWQHYINAVSSFINGYVDDSFEEVSDDTVRRQADYDGLIDLGGGPVSDVTSVKTWRTGVEVNGWDWDGFGQIQRLQPLQTVDVTYTHGYSEIPDDITYMVTDVVIGVLELGSSGPIKSFTVGDKTEVYDTSSSGKTAGVSLDEAVLNKYCRTEYTLRLGHRIPTSAQSDLPIP